MDQFLFVRSNMAVERGQARARPISEEMTAKRPASSRLISARSSNGLSSSISGIAPCAASLFARQKITGPGGQVCASSVNQQLEKKVVPV